MTDEPDRPTLFTVGHGSRSLEEFLALLREAAIACLVDIRRFPGSRRHPYFGRESLEKVLPAAGIRYLFAGDALGGRRRARPDSCHTALRTAGFRAYADHMATAEFVSAADRLLELAAQTPTAVMCAERLPWRCHRYFLADYLLFRGARVRHLIAADQVREHRLHPLARIDEGRLIYDRQDSEQLELEL